MIYPKPYSIHLRETISKCRKFRAIKIQTVQGFQLISVVYFSPLNFYHFESPFPIVMGTEAGQLLNAWNPKVGKALAKKQQSQNGYYCTDFGGQANPNTRKTDSTALCEALGSEEQSVMAAVSALGILGISAGLVQGLELLGFRAFRV